MQVLAIKKWRARASQRIAQRRTSGSSDSGSSSPSISPRGTHEEGFTFPDQSDAPQKESSDINKTVRPRLPREADQEAAVEEGIERLSVMAVKEDDTLLSEEEIKAALENSPSTPTAPGTTSPTMSEYFTPMSALPVSQPITATPQSADEDVNYLTPINLSNQLQYEITPVKLDVESEAAHVNNNNNARISNTAASITDAVLNPLIANEYPSGVSSRDAPPAGPRNPPQMEVSHNSRATAVTSVPARTTTIQSTNKSQCCCAVQ
jgi:hypothetical protein